LEQELAYVPALHLSKFRLYNVRKKTVREQELEVSFSPGAVYCFTEGLELIVVGGWPSVQDVFVIRDWKAVKQASLCTSRAWPGIYYWKKQTYVFGGNCPPITSCEKLLNGQWHSLPDMTYARYSFNPCYYHDTLWLLDLTIGQKAIESFSLKEERFLVLPYIIPAEDFSNSMAYMSENDEFVVISTQSNCYVWTSGQLKADEKGLSSVGEIRAYCPCPLLCYEAQVYFSNIERGQLGCYSRENGIIREIKDFTVTT
jgi:hypothetical protein